MTSRIWILTLCLIVLAAAVLLVTSLDELRFEPARPVAFALDPTRTLVLPRLSIDKDTPVWKILLFWFAFVANLVLFLLLLPADVRKRLLRQFASFALGILAIVLALRYQVLELPEVLAEPAAKGPAGIDFPPQPTEVETFHPPEAASWMTYVATLLFLWLALLLAYLLYRTWRRIRMRRSSALGAIAEIARSSLADIAGGKQWGDVVVQAYARMNEVVRVTRGVHRETSATPREFAGRLARTGLPAAPVNELTRLFESVRYGGRTSDDASARRAVICLELILHACGAEA